MTLRLIPPVAVPVGPWRVASTLVDGGEDAGSRFASELSRRLAHPCVSLFGSGRAALAAWLREAAASGRDEVVLPAYTCWTVPAAAVRAGLRVRLVDVDPTTLAPDADAVAHAVGARTAAVVAAHLFAPSCDVRAIADRVRRIDPSVKVLEDAAQAWPEIPPSPADAVLVSFGRGKPLPLGHGGALAAAQPLAAPAVRGGGWRRALELAATSLATRPSWYRIPESIPGLGVGTTEYRPDFDASSPLRSWQARLGTALLDELPRLEEERTANASRLAGAIEGLAGLRLPLPARGRGPIRFPVLVASRALRDALLPVLRRQGVSATAMYPGTLADIAELTPHRADRDAPFVGACEIRDRLLTLPVYPGLRATEIDEVAGAVERAWRQVSR